MEKIDNQNRWFLYTLLQLLLLLISYFSMVYLLQPMNLYWHVIVSKHAVWIPLILPNVHFLLQDPARIPYSI